MANLNTYTRDQIIAQGLQQGGNPGLANLMPGETVSRAVRFFNAAMHHMFLVFDLPGIETTGSINTSASPAYEASISTLTRFRSTRSIRVSGESAELMPANNYSEIWQRIQLDLEQSTVPTGTPENYFLKPAGDAFVLYPIPNAIKTLKVVYYAMPNIDAWTGSTTDFNFNDTLTMITMMEWFAKNWDKKVTEAVLAQQYVEKLFGQGRVAADDKGRHKPKSLLFNSNVWRPQRGR